MQIFIDAGYKQNDFRRLISAKIAELVTVDGQFVSLSTWKTHWEHFVQELCLASIRAHSKKVGYSGKEPCTVELFLSATHKLQVSLTGWLHDDHYFQLIYDFPTMWFPSEIAGKLSLSFDKCHHKPPTICPTSYGPMGSEKSGQLWW